MSTMAGGRGKPNSKNFQLHAVCPHLNLLVSSCLPGIRHSLYVSAVLKDMPAYTSAGGMSLALLQQDSPRLPWD